jgi:Mor family transcriptional regulator
MGTISSRKQPMPATRENTVERLTRLIGAEAFAKLSASLGGTEIHVPKGRDGETFRDLAHVIGEAAALHLVEAYGGDRLYIANCARTRLPIRNDAIRADFDSFSQAQSVRESMRLLSLKYHLSNRQLATILKRVEG